MNINELRTMQNYPLELKIAKTKLRIQEWVNEYGVEGVYVAFSGGKDSTVLLHIVRGMYPDIEGVFANTGNEFPEIIQFVRKQKNIKWVKPRKSFAKVIKEEGYPVISKKASRMISDCQNPTERNAKSRKLYLSDYTLDKEGNYTSIKNNSFKIANKHRYLINAPFKISNKCCDYLKKYPMKDYEKISGKKAIIGTQAEESRMRESAYLQVGCNNFKGGKSNPLGFWRSQDILEYIYKYNIEIASIYGEVKTDKDGRYYTTGEKRTGCCMCLYGCSLWKTDEENRVLRLEKTHPKLHAHMMKNLGFKEVLEYMNIKYEAKDVETVKVKLGKNNVEQFKWTI